VYVVPDLNIEITTDFASSLRPKWPIHFGPDFVFRHQVLRDGKIVEERATVKGPFVVLKIVHEVTARGDYQKVHIAPNGWELRWGE
jgi:hypothetical protein